MTTRGRNTIGRASLSEAFYCCKVSPNSHIAAMTKTNYPTLCTEHLDEVKRDGDLIRGINSPKWAMNACYCDMCAAKID